jgi:hypothetical protein
MKSKINKGKVIMLKNEIKEGSSEKEKRRKFR